MRATLLRMRATLVQMRATLLRMRATLLPCYHTTFLRRPMYTLHTMYPPCIYLSNTTHVQAEQMRFLVMTAVIAACSFTLAMVLEVLPHTSPESARVREG